MPPAIYVSVLFTEVRETDDRVLVGLLSLAEGGALQIAILDVDVVV